MCKQDFKILLLLILLSMPLTFLPVVLLGSWLHSVAQVHNIMFWII